MTNIRTNVAGTVILKNRPFWPGKGDRIFKKRKKKWSKSAKPDQIPEQGEPDRSDQRGKGASWLGQPGKVPP